MWEFTAFGNFVFVLLCLLSQVWGQNLICLQNSVQIKEQGEIGQKRCSGAPYQATEPGLQLLTTFSSVKYLGGCFRGV